MNLSVNKLEKFSWFLFIGVFVLFMVMFCIVRALWLFSGNLAYDMSLYFQAMFNTLKGHFLLMSTCCEAGPNLSYLAVHFSPIMTLVAPLYLIFPTAFVFPLLLVVLCGVAALPLKALARNVLKNETLANLIAVSYLTFIPTSSVMLWDFRTITFVIPLVLFAFYFLEMKKTICFIIFAILAMMAKEEMFIIFALVGVFLWIFKKEKTLGAGLFLFGLASAFIYAKILVPFLWKGTNYFWGTRYFGSDFSMTIILKRIFSFRSLQYLIFMFSPVVFTPFLSGGYLLIFIPVLIFTFLSTNPMQANIYYHYSGSLIPLIFITAVYGLDKFKPFSEKFLKFVFGWILVNVLITNMFFGQHFLNSRDLLNPGKYFKDNFRPERLTIFEAKKLVPADASILVGNEIGPWFAFREKYYFCISNLEYSNKVDYILIKLLPKYVAGLKKLAREGHWQVALFKNNFLLLKKSGAQPCFDLKYFQTLGL